MRKEKIARLAAVMACTLLIAGLSVQQAVANLAGCSNCIEASDIDVGAVNASELDNDLDDSINANDIATSGVGKTEIAADSVGVSELTNGATTAVGAVALSGSTTTTTATTLDQFTVTAPGAGYLRIHVDGLFYFDLDSADAASDIGTGSLGLCTAASSLSGADCGDALSIYYQDADEASSDNHTPFFSITRVIQVPAGASTFYLNGAAASGTAGLYIWDHAQADVTFAPAALTVT